MLPVARSALLANVRIATGGKLPAFAPPLIETQHAVL
jgi:hypothetical protein